MSGPGIVTPQAFLTKLNLMLHPPVERCINQVLDLHGLWKAAPFWTNINPTLNIMSGTGTKQSRTSNTSLVPSVIHVGITLLCVKPVIKILVLTSFFHFKRKCFSWPFCIQKTSAQTSTIYKLVSTGDNRGAYLFSFSIYPTQHRVQEGLHMSNQVERNKTKGIK